MDSLYCYNASGDERLAQYGRHDKKGVFKPNWGLKKPEEAEHRSRTRAVESQMRD